MKKRKKAFTLSEVLIALVIIGVIAAITIPVTINSYKWQQYKALTFKAKGLLDSAAIKYHAEYGYAPECGYWQSNPYTQNGDGAQCVERRDNGQCSRWEMKNSGDPLPSDYNGPFGDCTKLYQFWLKTFKVAKICANNAYANGCIPEYEGVDTMYQTKNPDKSSYDVMAAVGSSGFLKAPTLTGSAFITADGMIFFTYITGSSRLIAVDVNGFKKPNKWGQDVRAFIPRVKEQGDKPIYFEYNIGIESNGMTTTDLLYNKAI